MRIVSIVLILIFLIMVSSVAAAPLLIEGDCGRGNCLLTYPRYKFIQSSSNPDELWMAYDNHGGENFRKSDDGGLTWTATTPSTGLELRSWLNYHAVLYKDPSNNVHYSDVGSGQLYYRKVNYPAESSSDFGSLLTLNSGVMTANTYGHVVAQDDNNIFIIYRGSANSNANVRYFRSTNGGASFPEEGWVNSMGLSDVRIGALLINGMPAAIVQHLTTAPGATDFSYYIWDGNQFVANPDSIISTGEQLGSERAFNMIYHNGEMHVAWSNGDKLQHAWKNYNGGTGSWNKQSVVDLPYNPAYWFHPMFTSHGNDLYLIYSQVESSGTVSESNVYYTKWNDGTSTWDTPIALTTDGGSGGRGYFVPHGPNFVPVSSDFIPIVYTRAASVAVATGEVWFDKIELSPGYTDCSDIPPALLGGKTCQNVGSCGTPLNSANYYYILTDNVTASARCFDITSSDVTLDCNGHSVTYSTSSRDNGIQFSGAGTDGEIKNCDIIAGASIGFTDVIEDDIGAAIQIYGANAEIHSNNFFITGDRKVRGIRTLGSTGKALIHDNYIYILGEDTRGLWLERSADVYSNTINATGCDKVHAINAEYSHYYPATNSFSIYNNVINATKAGCVVTDTRSYNTILPWHTEFYNNTLWGVDTAPVYDGGVMSTLQIGTHSWIHDNTIYTTGRNSRNIYFGQDISDNITVFSNNFISVSDVYGGGSPFRIRDGTNFKVFNNIMNSTLFTKSAIMVGDSPIGTQQGEIYNNTMQGYYGFYFYETTEGSVYYHDNIILSADDAYYYEGEINPHNFTNDVILDCAPNCDSGRHDMRITSGVGEITLFNVSFFGVPDISIENAVSSANVKWYLDIEVQDLLSAPLSGADILVKDKNENPIFSLSSASPNTRANITEFIETTSGITNYTEHNVTVSYGGELQYRTVYMTTAQHEVFQFSGSSSDPDVNSDSVVNIIDLAIVVFNQGRSQVGEGSNWIQYSHLDIIIDTLINWNDVLGIIGSM